MPISPSRNRRRAVADTGMPGPPAGAYDADVVILALDRPEETIAAIGSALSQRGVIRHVFVVDQGSCPENLARVASAVAGRSDATLVPVGQNLGVPAGRNLGAALGHGRVIFGLDNDATFATPDTLAQAVAALDADPALAAIGCRIVRDGTRDDDLSCWGYPKTLLSCASDSFYTVTFVGAGHAIRRVAWQGAGGYDEALFFCWEEYDFCLRAIMHGWRIRYCGDVVVQHKGASERRVAWSGERWFLFVRNRLYLERKYGSSWGVVLSRFGGYVAKGLRNGMVRQTARALPAAIHLSRRGQRPVALSSWARTYLRQHDWDHRRSLVHRLRYDLFARLTPAAGKQARTE